VWWLVLVVSLGLVWPFLEVTAEDAGGGWPQWGGVHRDFSVGEGGGVGQGGTVWPEAGPRELWRRDLGPGYSSLVVGGGRLFTLYRDGENEAVIAVDAASGETLWTFSYPASLGPGRARGYGEGPHSTPLLAEIEGRSVLVAVGSNGAVHALDPADGDLLWSFDLGAASGTTRFGHAASPLPVDDTVVLLAGGSEPRALALDVRSGGVRWMGPPRGVSYASPILVTHDGRRQVVYVSAEEILGLDATSGELLWSSFCRNGWGNNAADPVWLPPDRVWVASLPDDGARLLRFLPSAADGDGIEVLWHEPTVSVHHWNAVPFGDRMITAVGSQGLVLAAVEIATGRILWRQRGFPKARLLKIGEELLVLDETGALTWGRPGADGLKILARAEVLTKPAWTIPALADGILYLRDQRSLVALDLRAKRASR
jgi:outer membrane protein assembly factor BamB